MDLKKRKILISLLIFTYCHITNAEADPVAEPDALPVPDPQPKPDAKAAPEADPQFWGGAPVGRELAPGGSGGPSVCELTNQCCGMANSQCCLGGGQQQQQKCYTVWERKCDTSSKPVCNVISQRDCHNIVEKTCRVVTDVVYKNFTTSECSPVPVEKCMTHQKRVCKAKPKTVVETIEWTNEKLESSGSKSEQHCIDQTKVDCRKRTITETIPRQVQKQRTVTDQQRRCKMVPNKLPDQEVTIPVTRVVYRTMCYNVPRSVCQQSQCAVAGSCPQPTSVCSLTETNTNTICPEPLGAVAGVGAGVGVVGGVGSFGPAAGIGLPRNAVGGGCQQVQQPVCYDQNVCQAASQQCCQTVNQQVCRQVPQRVTEQVKQTMPGQVTWQEQCQNYPITRQEYYTETEIQTVNRTVDDCQPSTTPDCHTYQTPLYTVRNETQTNNVNVNLQGCDISVETEKFCHTFYDEVCKNTTVQRGFRYNRQICDQTVNRQQCINLPVTDCRVGTTADCRMVPRQVCQDTCSTSPMCNQCDEFRNGPGFGSCGTSTCGTFYPPNPYRLNYTGDGFGGEGFYPGGGPIGGEGFYPGGGPIGGEGYFPGGDGGRQPWDDALTPPWVGGETRPPYDGTGRQPWDDALTPPWVGGETRPPYDSTGRQPWDDAVRPPWDGGETRPPYDGTGRQPWDDAVRPPWDSQARPPYAGGFNVAPAVPMGLTESRDSGMVSSIAKDEQVEMQS